MTGPKPDCRHCCLSRRECLKAVSAATLGATVLGPVASALGRSKSDAPAPTDFIDTRSLRPSPEVRIAAAFLEQPRPYWLGWPGTTYDLDARQKEYAERLAKSSRSLGLTTSLEAKPIGTPDGFSAFVAKLQTEKPHAVLVMLQHMSCWDWVGRLAREAKLPVIAFAPVGTAFTGHVAGAGRIPGVLALSTLEWGAVEDGLRIVRAKRRLEETRMLWIRGNERNETVVDRLGLKLRAIPRDTFNQEFDKQTVTDEVKDVAATLRKGAAKVVEPTEADIVNAGRVYVTAKRLLAAEKANALSMDCLGMVSSKLMPTPPCGAWTMLQDQGVTTGCEADLNGAYSMLLTSYLLDRPGYMNDPVPETYKNTLIASHCTSGTRLEGFDQAPAPYILRDHSESSLGVSTQVIWPIGKPVTLVNFAGPDELIVDTCKVVSNIDTPPAGGCRTSVELAMDEVEDCRDVRGFHQVVTLGHHRRILEQFCELYGIRHVHSPRSSTFAAGGAT